MKDVFFFRGGDKKKQVCMSNCIDILLICAYIVYFEMFDLGDRDKAS